MFCPNCGMEDVANERFCMNCGAELIDNQDFGEETTAQLVGRELKIIGKKCGTAADGVLRFAKKHKGISVLIGIILVLWIAVAVLNATLFSPKTVAKNYFLSVMEADAQKAYNCIDIVKSDFVDRTSFIKYWNDTYSKQEVFNYIVKERNDTYDDEDDGDEERLETIFDIQYYRRGQQNAEYMSVPVIKSGHKKLLIFNDYKVMPTFFVSDFSIEVPYGSKVTLDGQELYTPLTDYVVDEYRIKNLFSKEYEIEIDAPMAEPLVNQVVPYDYDIFCPYEYEYSDETVQNMFRQSTEDLDTMLKSIVAGREFPNSVQFREGSSAENYYYELQSRMFDVQSGTGITEIDLFDLYDNSYEQRFSADNMTYECDFSFQYDYTRTDMDWTSGELVENAGSGSGGANMEYAYVDGQWMLIYFNFWY